MKKFLQHVKHALKRVIKKAAELLHIDGPLRAAWTGYRQWKIEQAQQLHEKAIENDSSQNEFQKEVERRLQLQKEKAHAVWQCLDQFDLSKRKGIICIFQHSYFTLDGRQYISGGGERYATDLSYIIDQLNFQPVLIQAGNPQSDTPWVRLHGKNIVIGIHCSIEEYPNIISHLPKADFHIYSGFVDFGAELHQPNVIISHGITWDHPGANANIKLIENALFSAQELVSVDTSTICFLRSAFSLDLAQKKIPMHYVPNYADTEVYRPVNREPGGAFHIVFPRRSAPERGFWMMAEVLPQILERYPNINFSFVGFIHAEDMAHKIEQLQDRFPNRVHQRLVDAADMPAVYQSADISLIPTLYCEGTSLSCIEAMACGSAVIATNIGGLPDLIIDGYNGILISPDAPALYQAVCRLVEDPELRSRIRENAVRVAQCFSKNAWEARWNRLLTERLSN